MKIRTAVVAIVLAQGIVACGDGPVAPVPIEPDGAALLRHGGSDGTGLVLNSLTDVSVPLIGQVGSVDIDQAVITNFGLVEDVAGGIVGLEAEGVLQLTGGVLGTDVVTEDFVTTVGVTSSGPGQCDLITIDLGPIGVEALVAEVDVPAASVTGRGSGAVGSLLCNIGNLLGAVGGIVPGVGGLLNALNNRI